jgi:hypothetical protein
MSDTPQQASGGGPPAGWYQEPFEPQGRLRWWDGTQWTHHRVQAPVPAKKLRSGTWLPTKWWHWAALTAAALFGMAYIAIYVIATITGS